MSLYILVDPCTCSAIENQVRPLLTSRSEPQVEKATGYRLYKTTINLLKIHLKYLRVTNCRSIKRTAF